MARRFEPSLSACQALTFNRFRVMTSPKLPRVRGPEFPESLDWINTGGRPLTLSELRGKIVVLDFWTYG
jgi:hypothetical protein